MSQPALAPLIDVEIECAGAAAHVIETTRDVAVTALTSQQSEVPFARLSRLLHPLMPCSACSRLGDLPKEDFSERYL